jgi:hypothetical protein
MPDAAEKKLPPEYVAVPTAPVVYFDLVPTYGTLGGVVQIELATRVLQPLQDGSVGTPTIETAHLRCNPIAAKFLKDALEAALKMLEEPHVPPVAVGKLN